MNERRTISNVVVLGFAWALALGGTWLAMLSSPASAAVIADLRGNWVSGTAAGQTTDDTDPLDYLGTGRWDYYRETDTNPSNGGLTLLQWDSNAAGQQYELPTANHTNGMNNWADTPFTKITSTYGGLAINADEVAFHTGSNSTTNIPLVYQWTAGETLTGLTVAGLLRKTDTANQNVTLYVYKNDTLLGSGTAAGTTGYQFSFVGQDFVAGDKITIYADRAGTFNSDASALKASLYSLEEYFWTQTGDGSWGTGANWDVGTPPASSDALATFGSLDGTGPVNVTLDGANPTVAGMTFDNASRSFAINQGTGGTLTLGGVDAGKIWVVSGSHTIGAPVTLGNNAIVTVEADQQLAIGGAVSGGYGYGLGKAGAGTLTLSGANSYTGGTTVSDGTLVLSGSGTLGATTGTLALSGGALDLGALSPTVGTVSVTAAAASGDTLRNGSLTGTSYAVSNATGNAVISANLLANGTAGFTKTGAGQVTLSGANTYTGNTTLGANSGILTLANANAIQYSSLNFTGTGSTLSFDSSVESHSFTFGGLMGNTALALRDNAATPNPVALTVGNNNADTSYTGALSGDGSLTKIGTGTLTLTIATNTYTGGTTISAGTLQFGRPVSMPASGTVAVTETGTLAVNLGGANEFTKAAVASLLAGTGGQGGPVTWAAGATLGLNITNAATPFTYDAIIADPDGKRLNFQKLGAAKTLVLDDENTYTGKTTISTGVLSVASLNYVAEGTWAHHEDGYSNLGAPADADAGTIDIGLLGTAAQLTYTGTGETTDRVINLTGTGGSVTIDHSGAGLLKFTSDLTATGSGAKTLVLQGSTAGTGEIGGAIVNGAGATATHVTKLGTGQWTLSGANTYTGDTRVNQGTLVFAGSHTGYLLSLNNVGAQNAVLKILPDADVAVSRMRVAEVANSRGAVYQSGGTVTLSATAGVDVFRLGSNTNAWGYYQLSGGSLTVNEVGIGADNVNNSTGVMDITGGTFTSNGWITIGRGKTTTSGVLNVTGGSVEFSKTLGAAGSGTKLGLNWAATAGGQSILNVKNASVVGDDFIDLAVGNTANTLGAVNLLSGGVLQGYKVFATNPNPTAHLNFNGGTLKAHTTNAGVDFLTSANIDGVFLYSGGGTIDDNGTAITISRPLLAPTDSGVTSIPVTDGGSGYIGAPMVKITDGTGAGATAVANMVDDGTGNGTFKIDSITITSPGVYTVAPTTVTLVGGGATTAATLGTIGTDANTSGGLTKQGTGTLTLTGASTYTGGTTIKEGTLVASVAGALGANVAGNSITIDAGSNLALGAAAAVGSNQPITVNSTSAALGGISVAYNGLPTVTTDNTGDYGGVFGINVAGFDAISDLSALGAGKWFLGSTSTGTLDSASLAPGAGNVYRLGGGGGTLTVSGAGALADNGGTTRSATIGSASANGGGTVVFGAAQSYTGGTTIAGAALQMGAANVMPSTGAVTLANAAGAQWNLNNFSQTIGALSGGGASGGNIALGTATLTFGDASNTTYSGAISGTGTLVKQGAGRTALDGNASQISLATISAGTLAFTGAGPLPSYKLVADGGTVELGPTDSQTFAGEITGTGGLVKSGSATVTLVGANTYSGPTTISGGTLQLPAPRSVVDPVHRWSFNDGTAKDSIGTATEGTLYGTATISDGQLHMSGSSGNNRMVAALNSPLGYDKTLVSWFTLTNHLDNSPDGGPLGVESDTTGTNFDAIDYGERTPGQWCAGSDWFRRSDGVNNGGASETVSGSEIMIAISYDSVAGKITLYRNGVLYAQYNQTVDLQAYTATALALIGPRAATGGYFNGSVNEDRIYGSPLSAADIAALYVAGPNDSRTSLPTTTAVNITAADAALDLNGANQTIGSLAGVAGSSVTLGSGTLTTGGDATSTTFHGVISGSGGLVKQGGGVFTLTGTNTYTGPTTVNTGTLAVNGQLDSAGTVAVNAGATLTGSGTVGGVTVASTAQLSPGDSGVGTLTAAALDLGAGGLLNYEFNSTPANDLIVVQNADSLNLGSVGFRLYQEGTTNTFNGQGVYNLIQYSGAFTGSLGNLSVLNEALGRSYSFDADGGYIRLTIGAGLPYWTGGAEGNTDFRWSLASNWSDNAVPAADAVLVFGGEQGTTNINDLTNHQAGGIAFKGSTSSFSLGGNSIKLAGDIINNTTATQTILLDMALVGADRTVNTTSGDIILSGDLADGDGQPRGLVKTGNGTLSLRGDNFHTGTTTVEAGTLELYSAMQAMGGDLVVNGGTARLLLSNQVRSDKSIVVAGGTLDLVDKNNSVAGLQLAGGQIIGTGILTSASTIDLQSGTVSAILDCPVGISKTTAGTVVLSGDNTFIGSVTIGGGTLRMGSAGALNAASPGAVAFTADSTGTLQLGGNALTVTGLTTDSGAPGTTVVENASAAPAVLTANIQFSTDTFAGALQDGAGGGALGLTKSGAGNLVLSGANTFTGALNVNAGTLTVRSDLATPASATVTATGSKLALDGATLSVPTLTFNGGTLERANNGKFTTGTLNIQNSSQITTAEGDSVTTAINLSGNGKLTLGNDLSVSGDIGVQSNGSLDLGGKSLTARNLTFWNSPQPLARSGGGELHVNTLYNNAHTYTLDPNDTIVNLDIANSGRIITTSTGNITGSIDISSGTPGAWVSLGAPLVLTNHLAMRETLLYDKGYDITVGTLTNLTHLYAGEPNSGDLVREGGILTAGTVSFGRAAFLSLRPGDTVLTKLEAWSQRGSVPNFVVTQDPTVFSNGKSYDVTMGLTLENAAANALSLTTAVGTDAAPQGRLFLAFDNDTTGLGLDWAFRWNGDHIADLTSHYNNNKLVINLGTTGLTFDPAVNIWYDNPASGGDGYTYVGYRDTSISVEWDHTGSGTWATAANWTTDTAPGNAGDTATFGNLITDASAVVDLSGANPKVRNLIFNNTDGKTYEITAPSGGTLTIQGAAPSQTASIQVQAGTHSITAPAVLASDTTVTVAEGLVFTLGGNVSGTKALTKDGPGTLVLNSGTNAWAGSTTIAAGTVKLGASGALPHGAAAGNVTLAGTLDLNAHDTTLNGLSGAGTVTSSAAGNITLTLGDNDAAGDFSGVIENGSGTVNLVKTGSGIQTLGGANTYTGTTTVGGGTLALGAGGSINHSPTIHIGDGAILDVSAVTDGYHLLSGQTLEGIGTVNGPVTVDVGAVLTPGGSGIGTLNLPGDLTINGTYTWQMASLTSYDSIAVAAGSFTFDDDALLQLNYTGGTWNTEITADDEIVLVGSYHALALIPAANIQATGFGPGTFSTTYSDGNLLLLYTPGSSVTFSGNSKWTAAGDGAWGVNAKWTDTATGHESIHQAPGLGAQPEIARFDAGTTAGTAAIALDDGDLVNPTAVNPLLQQIRFGGDTAYTIQRGGAGQDLGGLTLQGISGGAAAIDVEAGAAAHEIAAPITLGSNTTVTTIDNAPAADLTLSGPISGSGILTKTGTGTLVLSSSTANTYGGTVVTGGTLVIGSAGALPAGKSLSIGSGGTLILGGGMAMGQTAAASTEPVPEPGTLVLLAVAAIVGVLAWRRRR